MLSLRSKQIRKAAQLLKLCTNTMITIRTIEIEEVETEVLIDFEMQFGNVEINKMTDTETGEAIAPDLLGETNTDYLYNELYEYAADYSAVKSYSRFNYED